MVWQKEAQIYFRLATNLINFRVAAAEGFSHQCAVRKLKMDIYLDKYRMGWGGGRERVFRSSCSRLKEPLSA